MNNKMSLFTVEFGLIENSLDLNCDQPLDKINLYFNELSSLFWIKNTNFYTNPIAKYCLGATLLKLGYNETYGQYWDIGYIYSLDLRNQNYGIIGTKFTELDGNEFSIQHYSEINSNNRLVYALTVDDCRYLVTLTTIINIYLGYENNNQGMKLNASYQK